MALGQGNDEVLCSKALIAPGSLNMLVISYVLDKVWSFGKRSAVQVKSLDH